MENRVPTTIEEVEAKLKATVGDNVAAQSMIGIFRVRMKMGDDLLKAYEAALKAYINAGEARSK